jgi:hypothetical protein
LRPAQGCDDQQIQRQAAPFQHGKIIYEMAPNFNANFALGWLAAGNSSEGRKPNSDLGGKSADRIAGQRPMLA